MTKPLRWVRSTQDSVLAGVCGGLARELDLPTWLVRLAWVLSVFIFGMGVLAYIACVIALPREDRQELARNKMILGVCAAIDRRGDMEVGIARLIALTLLFGTGGAALVGYIVLYFVLVSSADRPVKTVHPQR